MDTPEGWTDFLEELPVPGNHIDVMNCFGEVFEIFYLRKSDLLQVPDIPEYWRY